MDSVLTLIGLMYRANKLLFGETVLENMSSVCYLIMANDASEKTKERYLKKCHFYNIDCLMDYSSSELSKSLGKKNIKVIGLIDKGFMKTLLKKKEEVTYGKTDV